MAIKIEDYVSISDHLGRYCWAVDEGDADEWTALWEADGSFLSAGREPVVGHAALAEIPRFTFATWGRQLRHLVGNLCCDYGQSDDVVIARFYSQVTTWHNGANFCMALCTMTLNRHGDGWLIAVNDVDILQPPQAE